MLRGLRPDRLEIHPSSPEAPKIFKHWLYIFERYKESIASDSESCNLGLLANSLSSDNFEVVSDCSRYSDAIKKLKDLFIKTPNEVVAVSYTHLRAHETPEHLVCRHLLEKKNELARGAHASVTVRAHEVAGLAAL